eukprot:8476917-Alexandrium_andersonii.AAC.1
MRRLHGARHLGGCGSTCTPHDTQERATSSEGKRASRASVSVLQHTSTAHQAEQARIKQMPSTGSNCTRQQHARNVLVTSRARAAWQHARGSRESVCE